MNPLPVTLLQLNSGIDPEANIQQIRELLSDKDTGRFVIIPEVCCVRGHHKTICAHAAPINKSEIVKWLSLLAQTHKIWLLAGSIPEESEGRIFNTSILFKPDGALEATYRKIHLFTVTLPDGKTVDETKIYAAGAQPVCSEVYGWKCGLSVCFDLRFPSLFQHYREQGATVMTAPSDFTKVTGEKHWEILLRARAIETQSYVLAPNQCGINQETGIESFGNSMIIDPDGSVVDRVDTNPCAIRAELDMRYLQQIRSNLPII